MSFTGRFIAIHGRFIAIHGHFMGVSWRFMGISSRFMGFSAVGHFVRNCNGLKLIGCSNQRQPPSPQVYSVAFSGNGDILVSGSYDKTARVWNATPCELLDPTEGHSRAVYSVAMAPDGQTIVTGSEDATVRVWQASTGAPVATFEVTSLRPG